MCVHGEMLEADIRKLNGEVGLGQGHILTSFVGREQITYPNNN